MVLKKVNTNKLHKVKKESVYGFKRKQITGQILEYSLYFNQRIKDFNKKPLKFDELREFRKELKAKGIADLSPFWNDLINLKIRNPSIKLSNMKMLCTHISSTNVEGEDYHNIYIYPETSYREVKQALKTLQERMFKPSVQPLGDLGKKGIYDVIYKGLYENKPISNILAEIDEKFNFVVDEKSVRRIVKRMKLGL